MTTQSDRGYHGHPALYVAASVGTKKLLIQYAKIGLINTATQLQWQAQLDTFLSQVEINCDDNPFTAEIIST